jgi:hypothetical protein
LAPDAFVTGYTVEFDRMDTNGTTIEAGTTKQMSVTDTEANMLEVSDLSSSTLYAFRTRVGELIEAT